MKTLFYLAEKKKIPYSKTKCKCMVINGRKKDIVPELFIEDAKVEAVDLIEYLGDVLNSKGDYSDLVKDRKKGNIGLRQT